MAGSTRAPACLLASDLSNLIERVSGYPVFKALAGEFPALKKPLQVCSVWVGYLNLYIYPQRGREVVTGEGNDRERANGKATGRLSPSKIQCQVPIPHFRPFPSSSHLALTQGSDSLKPAVIADPHGDVPGRWRRAFQA